MKEAELKAMWTESVNASNISLDKQKMFQLFKKSRTEENLMKAVEFSDLLGGLILVSLVILVSLSRSEWISLIPLSGKAGGLLFLLTFLFHHTLSTRIRFMSPGGEKDLAGLLTFQLKVIHTRIRLLKSYQWLLLTGLSGLLVLFISLSPTMTTGIVSFLVLGVFGLVIQFLARKQINQQFLPLKLEIESELEQITRESNGI